MRDYLDNKPMKLRSGSSAQATPTRSYLIALFFVVLLSGLFYLDWAGYLGSARYGFTYVVQPVTQRFAAIRRGVVGIWDGSNSTEILLAENEQLHREMAQLKRQLIENEQIRLDNQRLRQQLGIQEQYPWQLLGAEIMMRSPDTSRHTVTIARGSDHGIRAGMAVIGHTAGEASALVGIVDTVTPSSATVLLINDFSSRISGRIIYKDRSALALLQGQWQERNVLQLEQLDRSVELQTGATVVSAGLSGNLNLPLPMASIPSGIPIGTIDHIITSNNYTQLATMRLYVNPDTVGYVWVIVSHKS